MISALFPKMMLEAWKHHGGDIEVGHDITDPIYTCNLKITTPTYVEDYPYGIWRYLTSDWPQWWALDKAAFAAIAKFRKTVLHIGAGSGRFATAFEKLGIECSSIDVSDDSIELMRLRGVPSVQRMNGEGMAFGDGEFEIVYCPHGVLEPAIDQAALIAEAARVASYAVVVSCSRLDTQDPEDQIIPEVFDMTWKGQEERTEHKTVPGLTAADWCRSAGLRPADLIQCDGGWIMVALV